MLKTFYSLEIMWGYCHHSRSGCTQFQMKDLGKVYYAKDYGPKGQQK